MIALLFLCLGLVLIGFGLYRLKGPVSVWYIAYGIATVEFNYVAIPGGITMAIWAFAMSPFAPDDWTLFLFNVGTVSLFLGLIPARLFLKPSWLRWLEREHNDIMPLIQQEIEAMGPRNWDRRINTQEELEKWVAEIRRKHGI